MTLPVGLLAMAALAASPAGIPWVHEDHSDTCQTRLVLDEGAQLRETPTGEPISRIPTPSLDPFADTLEILQSDPAPPPSSVESRKPLPDWFRLRWIHVGPKPDPQLVRGCRQISSWAIAQEIDHHLRSIPGMPSLDHFGRTVIGSFRCFVSEPYCGVQECSREAEYLAGLLGCFGLGLRRAHHNTSVCRMLLIPALEKP